MKPLFVSLAVIVLAVAPAAAQPYQRPYSPPRNPNYGSGPGDMRPRAPKPEKPDEPINTAMDEPWKWLLAACVVGMIVYTMWRLWSEASKVRPKRARQPWEIE
jgi:hypothetical protein